MRETQFIKQNKEKWSEFERELTQERKDSDKLNDLFIQLTDDLSYSRTYYKNRSVRYYLNGMAMEVFQSLGNGKKLKMANVKNFWLMELPLLMHQSRKQTLFIFVLFALSFIIGVVSSNYDSQFSSFILGEDYIQETLNNIKKNDPMAIYKDARQVDMFLGITINNLRVALVTFITGIFLSLGSLLVVVHNGIMVGVFQNFFIKRNLFQVSFLTIWMHGALEIPSILIAGTAGLALGNSIIMPGTYSRMQSLQMGGRKGFKIFCGIAPFIILAGIIESFVTRYTELPNMVRLLFILAEFTLIYLYFIWYPNRVYRAGHRLSNEENKISPTIEKEITLNEIKSNGQILFDTFVVYKKNLKKIGLFSVCLIIGSILLIYVLNPKILTEGYYSTVTQFIIELLNPDENKLNIVISGLILASVIIFSNHLVAPVLQLNKHLFKFNYLLTTLVVMFLVSLTFLSGKWVFFLFCIWLFPVLFTSISISFNENTGFINSIISSLTYLVSNLFKFFGFFYMFYFLLIALSILTSTSLFGLVTEFVQMNVPSSNNLFEFYVNLIILSFTLLLVAFSFPLLFIGLNFYVNSENERITASSLLEKIKNIKIKSK